MRHQTGTVVSIAQRLVDPNKTAPSPWSGAGSRFEPRPGHRGGLRLLLRGSSAQAGETTGDLTHMGRPLLGFIDRIGADVIVRLLTSANCRPEHLAAARRPCDSNQCLSLECT